MRGGATKKESDTDFGWTTLPHFKRYFQLHMARIGFILRILNTGCGILIHVTPYLRVIDSGSVIKETDCIEVRQHQDEKYSETDCREERQHQDEKYYRDGL